MRGIAYFVHGRGRGHAIRTSAVLERLDPRHPLRLYGASTAFEMLRANRTVEPVRAYQPGRGMVRAFVKRLGADRERLRAFDPCLVVSDGDGPSVHAAWSLGVPVLAVGHGLVFRHAHLGTALPQMQRLREAVNSASSSWPARRRVAVHFAPAEAATQGTVVARPDLDPRACRERTRESFILAYFRDDDGFAALEHLASRGHRIVWFGQPEHAPRGIEVHRPQVDAFHDALTRCRAVVGSAGNHLPAECAMMGLPMLALHRESDAEHTMNARLIESAGIGVSSTFEAFDACAARRFEADLDRDRSELMARTRAMPPASRAVSQIIEEMCPARGPSLRDIPPLTAPKVQATRPLPKGAALSGCGGS